MSDGSGPSSGKDATDTDIRAVTGGATDADTSKSDGTHPETIEAASDAAENAATQHLGSVFGFRIQDRRVFTVLTTILLVWLSVEWILVATRRPDPLLLKRGPDFQNYFRVDVNDSIWVDWLQLEGIGPSLAHRIIADRRVNGPFSSIDDVARVPGIGPGTLDRIRPWLTMGHDANEPNADARERSPEK